MFDKTKLTWKYTTKAKFEAAFNVLPPTLGDSHAFLQGEPVCYRECRVLGHADAYPEYPAYARVGEYYVYCTENLTIDEFSSLSILDVRQCIIPPINEAQYGAIKLKADQTHQEVGELLETAACILGGDGAVSVHWCNMWLAIEPDGYTHS